MFCSNCGSKASGNFCHQCGARLTSSQEESRELRDWEDEIRYDVLLRSLEVRELIATHAARAQKGVSAEEFLKLCDKVLEPLTGFSLGTVGAIVAPIYARIGIRTSKTRSQLLPGLPGKILVAALCSLARYGRTIKKVHQGKDGCVLEAVVPSDMWSWEGELVITIQRHTAGTQVEAATNIPGQLYDWGKSKQCLNQLFEDLQSLLS